jgi:hypothetical protein
VVKDTAAAAARLMADTFLHVNFPPGHQDAFDKEFETSPAGGLKDVGQRCAIELQGPFSTIFGGLVGGNAFPQNKYHEEYHAAARVKYPKLGWQSGYRSSTRLSR